MKAKMLGLCLLAALLLPGAEGKKDPESPLLVYMAGKAYDEAAAREFVADRYGMRRYVVAFLKRGPNRPADRARAEELQKAHLKNIGRMAAQGKLALAGPFLDDGELRGIYVFCVDSLAEAEALTRSDPAIQAGSLVMELKEWYGSAALLAVNAIHGRLEQQPVAGE
jgi:uncharacterized protein YciI